MDFLSIHMKFEASLNFISIWGNPSYAIVFLMVTVDFTSIPHESQSIAMGFRISIKFLLALEISFFIRDCAMLLKWLYNK